MRPAALSLAALCALALSSCGNTLQVTPIPHQQLEGLVVAPFPVYWAGASLQKLDVTEASHDPSDAYTVAYGNCVRGGQGYCVPPLRIVTSPDTGFIPGGASPVSTARIRGARAVIAEQGRTILIPTGAVMLSIYAHSAPLARAAAEAAVPINAPANPGESLPARLPPGEFDSKPLPSQVPDPLHPLGVPLSR